MNSRTTPIRMPASGLLATCASSTTKLAYGSSGISRFGIAVNMSSRLEALHGVEHPRGVLHRAAVDAGPIADALAVHAAVLIRPRVVRKFTTLLRDAGPLHEAEPCSQIEHATRFADTDTPEPELVPRGTRSVSYGLHAWPPQAAYA